MHYRRPLIHIRKRAEGLKMKVYVVALCGFLLAAPALAQPSGTAGSGDAIPSRPSRAPESASGGEHAAPRQICRRIDSDTSRRIGSRLVCHTAEEWRDIQDGS
jgi:hypothetical protein